MILRTRGVHLPLGGGGRVGKRRISTGKKGMGAGITCRMAGRSRLLWGKRKYSKRVPSQGTSGEIGCIGAMWSGPSISLPCRFLRSFPACPIPASCVAGGRWSHSVDETVQLDPVSAGCPHPHLHTVCASGEGKEGMEVGRGRWRQSAEETKVQADPSVPHLTRILTPVSAL